MMAAILSTPTSPRPRQQRPAERALLSGGASLRALMLATMLALMLPLGILPSPASAQAASNADTTAAQASEERVKAAYLYRFPHYVEWPGTAFARPDAAYVIGVLGSAGVAEELRRITAGRTINQRPITVRSLDSGEKPNGLHMLFIGAAEQPSLPRLARQTAGQPVLIVTEAADALAAGSMLNFRIVDERVRFEVALDAAERAGLKLSARLLAIALSVRKGDQK